MTMKFLLCLIYGLPLICLNMTSPVVGAEREEKARFKGVELYSWQAAGDDGKWTFVLVNGTNRLKVEDDIKKNPDALKGVEPLKKALALLAKGEMVIWLHHVKGFEFPAPRVQKEIAVAAKSAGVDLHIKTPTEWTAWAKWAAELYDTSDGKGHGPDLGSNEWAGALDRKLGIRDKAGHGPDIKSAEWRHAVERKLLFRRAPNESPGGYSFAIGEGKKPGVSKNGKFFAHLPSVTPISFSPVADILLVNEKGEDDDLRCYLLNIGAGEFAKKGSRLDYVFGGRYFTSAKWSDDGETITLFYHPAAGIEKESFKVSEVLKAPAE